MQPGDSIQPNIKIANYGTVNPSTQGSFEVDLVASTQPNFGPGSQVVSRFTVSSLAPLADVPSQNTVLGDVNVKDPINVLTLEGAPTTLPTSPTGYFLGVIVDPQNNIREIHEVGRGPSSALSPVVTVGNPIPGLPPAGVVTSPPPISNVFPIPANGVITVPAQPSNTALMTLLAEITGSSEFAPGGSSTSALHLRRSTTRPGQPGTHFPGVPPTP
jgi:hypothetical protein